MADFSAPPVIYWSEKIVERLDSIDYTLKEILNEIKSSREKKKLILILIEGLIGQST